MATTPNLPNNPRVSSTRVTSGNSSSQGGGTIGTDIFLAGTVGTSGSFIERVRFSPTATTATSTTATVARIFYSTVSSGTTTNTDTFLIGECVLPSVSAANASSSNIVIDFPVNISYQSGLSILVTNHSSPAANTVWVATLIGVDY
jgi:hypothetical protein